MKRQLIFSFVVFLYFNLQFSSAQSTQSEVLAYHEAEEKAKKTIRDAWDKYIRDINVKVATKYAELLERRIGLDFKNQYHQLLLNDKVDFDKTSSLLQDFSLAQTSVIFENLELSKKLNDIEEQATKKSYYNPKMLERFKAKEVSAFFDGVEDLALQEFYATYNTSDQSISIGKNTSLLGKASLDKLDWILKTGATIKTSSEFGAVFENGEFQRNNFVLNLGISKFARGFVNFRKKRKNFKEITKAHREEILKKKIQGSIEDYLRKNFKAVTDSLKILNNEYNKDADYVKKLTEFAKNKQSSFYSLISKAEIDFIKGNSLYRSFETNWFTANLNIPAGKQDIISAQSASDSTTITNRFYPMTGNISFSYFWKKPGGISYFTNISLNGKNNHNFLAENSTAVPFQQITSQTQNQQALNSSTAVFIGDYNSFFTPSLKFEFASLFISEFLGSSISVEQNFGTFNDFNFIYGVPIIIKSKGKPTINLELQYRNFGGKSQFGFSTSLLLANLIK